MNHQQHEPKCNASSGDVDRRPHLPRPGRAEAVAIGPRDRPQQTEVRISVVLPVKNGAATIESAVASVLADLGPSDELIIVDDSSDDDTRAVVASFRGPIRVLPNRGNGLVDALNTGIVAAQGRYLARCDADDEWLPGHADSLLAALTSEPEAIAVFGASVLTDSEGHPRGVSLPPVSGEVGTALLRSNPFIHGTVLVERRVVSSLGGYRDYPGAEDYDLWMRLARGGAIASTRERVYSYRLSTTDDHRAKRRRQARSTVRILIHHALVTGEVSVCGLLRNIGSAVWPGRRFWYRS